jgi:hypothetical protein
MWPAPYLLHVHLHRTCLLPHPTIYTDRTYIHSTSLPSTAQPASPAFTPQEWPEEGWIYKYLTVAQRLLVHDTAPCLERIPARQVFRRQAIVPLERPVHGHGELGVLGSGHATRPSHSSSITPAGRFCTLFACHKHTVLRTWPDAWLVGTGAGRCRLDMGCLYLRGHRSLLRAILDYFRAVVEINEILDLEDNPGYIKLTSNVASASGHFAPLLFRWPGCRQPPRCCRQYSDSWGKWQRPQNEMDAHYFGLH